METERGGDETRRRGAETTTALGLRGLGIPECTTALHRTG